MPKLLVTSRDVPGWGGASTRAYLLFEKLQRSNQELMQAYDTTLEGWARALELRDRETEGHTRRVTELTLELARFMGIGESELVNLHRGVLLHDIGKMGVPDHILNKPGALTPEELAEMQKHPQYGYEVILKAEGRVGVRDDAILAMAKDIVYTHHERWDGTGYPRRLRGTEIPVEGRVMALVDVYDATTTRNLYRPPMSHDDAVKFIVGRKATHFDPAVVQAFVDVAPRFKIVSAEHAE